MAKRKPPSVPPAPPWSPGRRSVANLAVVRADSLTARALSDRPALAGAALAARGEARIAAAVAEHRPHRSDVSGLLPFGPGRPRLAVVQLSEFAPGGDGDRPMIRRSTVHQRLKPGGLRSIDRRYHDAAEILAEYVAMQAAPTSSTLLEPAGGGRISDGGAVAGVDRQRAIREAYELIGRVQVLPAPGAPRSSARARPLDVCQAVGYVVLQGHTLHGLLGRFGWPKAPPYTTAVVEAIEAALARLQARWYPCHGV